MTQLLLAPQPVESGDLKDVVMMDDSIFGGFEEVSLIQPGDYNYRKRPHYLFIFDFALIMISYYCQ